MTTPASPADDDALRRVLSAALLEEGVNRPLRNRIFNAILPVIHAREAKSADLLKRAEIMLSADIDTIAASAPSSRLPRPASRRWRGSGMRRGRRFGICGAWSKTSAKSPAP